MILDWLDRILARLLPVRTRNGGRHSHVKGDPFDRDGGQEFLPYMRPGSYSSAPDSPLAFRSFGDPNLGAAALSVPLEMHHPQTRVRPLPVPPLASERPDTPTNEQMGLWHRRTAPPADPWAHLRRAWSDDTGSFARICEVA